MWQYTAYAMQKWLYGGVVAVGTLHTPAALRIGQVAVQACGALVDHAEVGRITIQRIGARQSAGQGRHAMKIARKGKDRRQ